MGYVVGSILLFIGFVSILIMESLRYHYNGVSPQWILCFFDILSIAITIIGFCILGNAGVEEESEYKRLDIGYFREENGYELNEYGARKVIDSLCTDEEKYMDYIEAWFDKDGNVRNVDMSREGISIRLSGEISIHKFEKAVELVNVE